MAGDWMPMRLDLHEDPSVFVLEGKFGETAYSIVGRLHRVWAWFNKHTEDGFARGCTAELVDRTAGVSGFADAMAAEGWLELGPDGVEMLNFNTWNGGGAKKRLADTKRKRRERETKDDRVSENCPKKVGQNSDKSRTTEQNNRQTEENMDKDQRQGGHPDSISVCLSGWRIGEPSRSQLISAGLEVPDAFAAWEAAAGARDRKAAFVWACKQGLGLETRKATKAVPMSPEMQRVVSRIEAARKNKGGAA